MTTTTTAALRIGFRRGGSEWQRDLDEVIRFACAHGFEALDVGPLPRADLHTIIAAGLSIGTIDLPSPWSGPASADAQVRSRAVEAQLSYVRSVVDLCPRFFTVIIPEDPTRKRSENFAFAVDGYGRLCEGMTTCRARLVIEGWPGGGPHLANLACTPADYRALLREMPASAGINFDPSHLVRMGIDPVRFLEEFASRVHHVHAKDTDVMPDAVYEHGWSQAATFAPDHGFGGTYWRYTIPGHGQVRWNAVLQVLSRAGYDGVVSVELEDERYNGTPDGEQAGLVAARHFLQGV